MTICYNLVFFFFFMKILLGCDGESGMAILYLGILFVILGEFVLFCNEFVNFAKFYNNVTTFVFYTYIFLSEIPWPTSHIFKTI